jgi:alpha-glucosidase
MDACKSAYEGIENNSDARGFVWSVAGWAGTHRNSVVWTGDQKGSWNYIRWHIPTFIGSGLSAQNSASSDIDGIFAGSDKTYTRDLQWKCFTPVFMSMSGWAPKDKQPYVYGEPFTSINRKYLMLKMRLTPYMYTLCNEAYETGVPSVRGLLLEYPNDPVTWGTETQYEFLLGKNFLVAPVYRDEEKRDSIYFPAGKWFDYWDGTIYKGNTSINNYVAPLDKLPLFVKGGSIIPMYPQMYFDGERPADTLTLDIYPGENAEFEMFEDDGSTKEYRKGAFAKTKLTAIVNPLNKEQIAEVNIAAAKGNYKGKQDRRTYILQIHTREIPKQVLVQGAKLKKLKNDSDLTKAKTGWYYNPDKMNGIVYIKTDLISTSADAALKLNY